MHRASGVSLVFRQPWYAELRQSWPLDCGSRRIRQPAVSRSGVCVRESTPRVIIVYRSQCTRQVAHWAYGVVTLAGDSLTS